MRSCAGEPGAVKEGLDGRASTQGADIAEIGADRNRLDTWRQAGATAA